MRFFCPKIFLIHNMKCMKGMCEEEVVALGSIIAITICKEFDENEILTIKNLLSQIYSSMCVICSQKSIKNKGDKK